MGVSARADVCCYERRRRQFCIGTTVEQHDEGKRQMQMRFNGGKISGFLVAGVLLMALAGCQSDESALGEIEPTLAQPYAGLEQRDIRALAPERVADLLAGRGAGFALSAELNHYPGPTHVLQLAEQLELTIEQHDAVSAVKTAMQEEAAALGARLVDEEQNLDDAFRSGTITAEQVSSMTERISGLEGQLRNVHLQAHVVLADVLTESQVATYDALRGYGAAEGGASHVMPESHSM
jgi:hypothetical protein